MSTTTSIQWTDASWNPVVGCKMVSPGCANCYAETMSNRLCGMARKELRDGKNPGRKSHYLKVINEDGRWNGRVELVPEALSDPLKWKKPRLVFVNSMSDLFHEDVPFEFVDQVCAVMALTPWHTYQVLTKRPERMEKYMNTEDRPQWIAEWNADEDCHRGDVPPLRAWPLPNVWLGCSPVNQKTYDEYKPHLLRTPAAVRFLSLEPLLGPIELGDMTGIGWVIVGGESGSGARPFDVTWARSIVSQCIKASVPVFVKQFGAVVRAPYYEKDDHFRDRMTDFDPKVLVPSSAGFQEWPESYGQPPVDAILENHLTDKKGGDPEEWPEDLRVRQMPEVRQ